MNKICPLMSYRNDNDSRLWCEKEKCAWWVKEQGCCAIITQKKIEPITYTSHTGEPYYISPSSMC